MGDTIGTPLSWGLFLALVGGVLALDLLVIHRMPRPISLREATAWTALWVSLALVFCLGIWVLAGPTSALEFLTAYLLEKSLSVDNLFVFLALFAYFRVPAELQHRVLSLGILGAVVLRGAFILAGVALVSRFHWLLYVFGALLVLTGVKLLVQREAELNPQRNLVVRMVARLLPVATDYQDGKFLVSQHGRLLASPLLVVLVVIELSDLMFATDSVPAAIAVTTDPFVVFTSNILAVLGLRALFFVLARLLRRIRFLQAGIALVLVFVGAKMLAARWWQVPISTSLLVIASLLAGVILASVLAPGATVRDRRAGRSGRAASQRRRE